MKNKYMEKRLENNLRNCQLKQVELLKQLDRICRKYQLDYWIDCGTLLGAVRHKGFIPWDDDIDVAMLSKDYNKFLELAQAELPQEVFLQTNKTDLSYFKKFAKLMDLNSLFLSNGDDLSLPYQKGIYIDIFEFVEYPTMPKKWIKKLALSIGHTQYFFTIKHYYSYRLFLKSIYAKIKLSVLKQIWRFCMLLPKGKYISNVIEENGYGIVLRVDSVFPLGQIEFEGEMFNCPRNPDEYLNDIYSNYTELPPLEKRISHSIYIEPDLTANVSLAQPQPESLAD